MAKFSFVLLCYNNWKMTKQAIKTLLQSFESIKDDGIELIIVDNGSSDQTPEEIDKLKKDEETKKVKIVNVRLDPNMGYTPGINAGLAKCNGQYIAVLNNDLIFPANWFTGIVETLEKFQDIGMAAPYLSSASGLQNIGKTFTSFEEMQLFASQFMQENKQDLQYSHRVIGACMVFKREVIEKIGGNDIWFGLGQFDDDDWCIRTQIAGYKIAVIGKSFVQHLSTVTYNQQSEVMQASFLANKRKFRKKWDIRRKKTVQDVLNAAYYSKEQHFFPIKKEDFAKPILSPSNKVTSNNHLLIVADWNNHYSKWKEKLIHWINTITDDTEIHLWVPTLYYRGYDLLYDLQSQIPAASLEKIIIHYENIVPTDLIVFLTSFDALCIVENDYVNRYMVQLVKDLLPIV